MTPEQERELGRILASYLPEGMAWVLVVADPAPGEDGSRDVEIMTNVVESEGIEAVLHFGIERAKVQDDYLIRIASRN